jgi:tetratricopeptide (TPR) repeat protein
MRLIQGGKSEEGLAAMHRAGELDPTHFETWVHLGEALVGLGRGDEAIEAAKRGVELSHGVAHAVHQLANIHGRLGKRAEALALMAPFERPGARRNPFDIAFFHFTLKNYEKAVTWLMTACDERNPQMAFFHLMEKNKLYDPLREDPRYPALMVCATPGTPATK